VKHPDIPQLGTIVQIVDRLKDHSPARGPGWTVGVKGEAGAIRFTHTFTSYDKVDRFAREMAELGYHMRMIDPQAQDCDFVFTPDTRRNR
jgi:hypothetical protein